MAEVHLLNPPAVTLALAARLTLLFSARSDKVQIDNPRLLVYIADSSEARVKKRGSGTEWVY